VGVHGFDTMRAHANLRLRLEVGSGLADRTFADLPTLLRAGDLLVFNDTRVIPARLAAVKETGGRAEILIERVQDQCVALAQVRASKTPQPGSSLTIAGGATARVQGRQDESWRGRCANSRPAL
jgi:S-adenosylmethionine:tRNA ribosyltransferase-isomerase